MTFVRVSKPVNDEGWVVTYPELVDKSITFLWNHGLCHGLITKSIRFHIRKAKKTGKFSYCEIDYVDNDLK